MTAFAARRARLLAQMVPGAVAILPTAPEVPRNSDSDYPYRHDSYFYYLTGFTEPDSVLVLVAASDGAAAQAILFCRQKNMEREIWDGFRHGPDGARGLRLRLRLRYRRTRHRDDAPAVERAGRLLRARPQRPARPANEDLAEQRAAPGAQRRDCASHRA
ncbi:aminopeptidase P N-terminal domain-containing protein [Massilia sp. H-1]|nr:aminopeptidase P N-terminal domain-containing protein [Massilia sp. H-1]